MAAPSLTHVPDFRPDCVLDSLAAEAVSFEKPDGARLTLGRELVPVLLEQANHGFEAAPRGGIEVGGLLIGPVPVPGEPVTIQEVIPLNLEYRFGPSFRPSATDLVAIAEAVAAARRESSGAVIGLYRSHIRGELSLRESDREWIRVIAQDHDGFEAEFQGLMVLRPLSGMRTSATMLWANQFQAKPEVVPAKPSVVAEPEVPAPPVALPAPPQPGRPVFRVRGRRRAAILLTLGATGVITAGAYAGFYTALAEARQSSLRAAASPVDLGLSATPREDHGWKLTWNGAAISKVAPSGGVLTIRDGNEAQDLNLTPADLASGNLLYRSRNADLLFLLSVRRDGGPPLEQRIRVLDGQAGTTPAPAVVATTPKPRTTEAPPSVTTFQAVIRPASDLHEAVSVPPKPLREVDAEAPSQPLAAASLEVKVRIQIDTEGKVMEAAPIARTAENARWMDRATSAARRWLFEPARENGRPVPGEAILTFLFRP